MTREEIKNIVCHVFHFYEVNAENCNWADMHEACGEILKALEQQPCEDCISREAVIGLKTIAPIAPVMDGEAVHYEEVVFVRDLEKLPSVETERKHGHWIMQNDRSKKLLGWLFCSECNAWIGEPTDYCSNCGAKMEGTDE